MPRKKPINTEHVDKSTPPKFLLLRTPLRERLTTRKSMLRAARSSKDWQAWEPGWRLPPCCPRPRKPARPRQRRQSHAAVPTGFGQGMAGEYSPLCRTVHLEYQQHFAQSACVRMGWIRRRPCPALVFNSQSTRSSSLGAKWTHSYNVFLTGSGPVVLVEGDGTETPYTLSGTTYTPPAGCYDTLVQNTGGTWTLTRKGGTRLNFTSGGVLSSIVDTNGLTTTLAYTSGLLTTVTDAAGRTLTLGYTSGLLTSVTDCQSKTYTVAYTSSLPTSLATPPLSGTTYNQQLTYDANGNVASLSDRIGRRVELQLCGQRAQQHHAARRRRRRVSAHGFGSRRWLALAFDGHDPQPLARRQRQHHAVRTGQPGTAGRADGREQQSDESTPTTAATIALPRSFPPLRRSIPRSTVGAMNWCRKTRSATRRQGRTTGQRDGC